MRKTFFFLFTLLVLVLSSCSNAEDQDNVCQCEMLYRNMQTEKSVYEGFGMNSAEAQDKVDAEYKTEFDNCTKIKEDLGESSYFKYSQECGGK